MIAMVRIDLLSWSRARRLDAGDVTFLSKKWDGSVIQIWSICKL